MQYICYHISKSPITDKCQNDTKHSSTTQVKTLSPQMLTLPVMTW